MSYDICPSCGRPATKCECQPCFVTCVPVGTDAFVDAYAAGHHGFKGACTDCGQALWRSLTHLPAHTKAICPACMERRLQSGGSYDFVLTAEATAIMKDMDAEHARRN